MECSSHCIISGDTWVWLVPLLCILALITFLLMFHPLILASVNDSCLTNYHCDVCEVVIFLIPKSFPHLAVSITLSKNTFLQHFIIIYLFILIYSYGFLFYVLLTIKFHYFFNAKRVQYLANGWLFNFGSVYSDVSHNSSGSFSLANSTWFSSLIFPFLLSILESFIYSRYSGDQ